MLTLIHPNSQLRQERIRRNWRQQDVADQLGTTVLSIKRWERGSHQPSMYFREKLCALFGKSVEELGIIPQSIQPSHMIEGVVPQGQLAASISREEPPESSVADPRNPYFTGSEEMRLLQNNPLHSRRPIYWNIPFIRNPFFTGREYELERLHAQLHQHRIATVGQTQAISGLGGIGKTQLVIEYAYRYCQEYQSVLWVRADSTEALNSSYTELAILLNLPEKDAKEQELIIQAVKTWLETNGTWLLILDNLDESEETLFPPDRDGKPRHPSPFLPMTSVGHILITSRAADLSALGLGITHPLHLATFSDDQGVRLLLHRAGLL
ncbi:MAG: XRE family transcriptional regulator, partial [Ktedonobacteraceae bacterium]|nr:XRE family transcriptional regulator [Ktedonobacteraceae bacterium]